MSAAKGLGRELLVLGAPKLVEVATKKVGQASVKEHSNKKQRVNKLVVRSNCA